jgi:hypothetical protein
MAKLLKLSNLIEEIQDYIADNSGLGYVVGQNFTAENSMSFTDIGRLLSSQVLLTIFDEGGELVPSGRLTIQNRIFRFVTKGTTPNDAMDRARSLVEWLWNHKNLLTSTYRSQVRTLERLPTIIDRGEDGSTLVDFVVSMVVFNRL